MEIDKDGWCDQAVRMVSPNQNERPENERISLLVIHNISLPPGQFGSSCIPDLFMNRLDCDQHPFFDGLRQLKVSSHFFIRRDGSLFQFVSADRRAWHAGVSFFRGREGVNDFSIGIEVEGTDFDPFMPKQYETLAELTAALCRRYPLVSAAGHQHIAPSRKTDPGPFFRWDDFRKKLAEKGVLTQENRPLEFPFG